MCPYKGQLLIEQEALCYNDPAVYSCTNNNSGYLRLEVHVNTGEEQNPLFNNRFTPEGSIKPSMFGSTPVVYNVTSLRTSFIRVTISIPNLVDLVGTTITCGTETVALDYLSRNISKHLIYVILFTFFCTCKLSC